MKNAHGNSGYSFQWNVPYDSQEDGKERGNCFSVPVPEYFSEFNFKT